MKRIFTILTFLLLISTSVSGYNHEVVAVRSALMDKDIAVTVITPDGYADGTACYPVVYLLHGFGDDNEAWHQKGLVAPLADQYGLIFVCPDGGKSWYWDSPVIPTSRYESFIATELIEWVDRAYRTNATREGRAITGLSMGGQGALYLALRHQHLFGAVGSTSGGVDIRPFPDGWDMAKLLGEQSENAEVWEEFSVMTVAECAPTDGSLAMIIDCGTEDFFYEVNLALHQKLLTLGVPHDFYVRPGRHHWPYWQGSIKHQMLFFDNYFCKR